ncbi:MAG TPA: DNA polymerase III subunit gamma and tau [Mycobacteriales bacterium]|nr:DNA polymerase III subunit gamma and tau [Mycobacteriales bacterium]
MSAALYNRYRPRTFSEVVGQDHVTAALTEALRTGRTHHAYLFSGPRGCGKTSSARILAASLNCEKGPTPEPCGVCEQCVGIRTGSSIDVVEIDAASHGGVDDARDLRERALYVPASARYRVFIIDEAHQVSRDGFNALLKIVEEPPAHLVFVFATTEPEKVLPTIRSRTFSYAFRLVPPAQLRAHLARICAAEGVEVEPEVLPLVVRAGGGSVRDAMSVLDQLIAGGAIQLAQASALLGVTETVLLDDAVEALSARDGAALFGVVDRVVGAGHDPRRFSADLLERLRDLVLLQAVPEAAERGLVEGVAPDQLTRMRRQAGSLGAAELSRAADTVHAGLVDMRGTASPRLLLELVCARLLLPAADGGPASTLARLDAVERRIALGAHAGPALAAAPGLSVQGEAPRQPAAPRGGGPGSPAEGARPVAARPAPARAAGAPAGAADTPAPGRGADDLAGPGAADTPVSAGTAETPARPAATDTPAPAGPADTTSPAGPADTPAPAGTIDVQALRHAWPLILEAVKRRSRVPHAMLSQHGEITAVEGDRVEVAITRPPIARQFKTGPGVDILTEALVEVVGGRWRVSVVETRPEQLRPAAEGFAPGDEPAPDDAKDRAVHEEDDAGAAPQRPAPPDPIGLLKDAFGATVIEETDSPS